MTYRYTYKITLLKSNLADHYYYGRHKTENLNDGYAGSGRILVKYYSKYGAIEGVTYNKEIVAFYDNEDELNQAEYELIGDKYETDPLCLNLRAGGVQPGMSSETIEKLRCAAIKQYEDPAMHKLVSKRTKEGMHKPENWERFIDSRKRVDLRKEKNPFYGKHHTESAKQLNREAHLNKKHKPETIKLLKKIRTDRKWVNNGFEEHWVKDDELQQLLDNGFVFGRLKRTK